jgi:hypothetical protein
LTKEEKDIKYNQAYQMMIERGFMLKDELSKFLGIKTQKTIIDNFESLGLLLYQSHLTDEEKNKLGIRLKADPVTFRALNPIYEKWRKENKQLPAKNGHVISNQKGFSV